MGHQAKIPTCKLARYAASQQQMVQTSAASFSYNTRRACPAKAPNLGVRLVVIYVFDNIRNSEQSYRFLSLDLVFDGGIID
jgi:hypothetical protein